MKNDNNTKQTETKISLDYGPYFKAMEEAGISQNRLKTVYDVSAATISRMKHDENMTLHTAGKLMEILGMTDIADFVTVTFSEEETE